MATPEIHTWYTAHTCLHRARLPCEVALRIRGFVDPQLAVRCGRQLAFAHYNKLTEPLEDELRAQKRTLNALYTQRARMLTHIEQTCTHPQRRRLCEPGCYGDRYWQCPDCHKEW